MRILLVLKLFHELSYIDRCHSVVHVLGQSMIKLPQVHSSVHLGRQLHARPGQNAPRGLRKGTADAGPVPKGDGLKQADGEESEQSYESIHVVLI